jgi:RNase H-fold protein (predicted Holliday junction resolvase)
MAEDKFKAQAQAIVEGCPFNMEDAIADDLRQADAENQRLRKELWWALEMLERHATSTELIEKVREVRSLLSQEEKS